MLYEVITCEMEVPIAYLQTNNTITCRVEGNNTDYTTVILRVYDFSKAPGRSANGSGVSVNGISLGDPVSVMQGQTKALSVIFDPVNATNTGINWTSSNPSVATVSNLGVVTAVAATGSTTITRNNFV